MLRFRLAKIIAECKPRFSTAWALTLIWRFLGRRTGRAGSVIPIVALSGFVIIGFTGLAIDGSRLLLMHSKLQTSLDAAGLSSAAKMTTSAVDSEIDKFLKVNFGQAYVDATLLSHSSTLSADEKTLTVKASAKAPTTFMQIFGIPTMTVDASTEITRATGGLELALVLDVTGSMRDNNKLGSLKSAAKDLLQIVFGDNSTVENLHVGIVPFTQTVNVGASRTNWLTGTVPRNWSGCVEMRHGGIDATDKPISTSRFSPLTSGTCPPPITPLSSSKSKLTSAVNALSADGGTNINVGAVWGWRLLSPKWRGAWGGDMGLNLPLDYDSDGMSKAAVIMTDGMNAISNGSAYGDSSCTRTIRYFFGTYCVEWSYDDRLNVSGSSTNDVDDSANAELERPAKSMNRVVPLGREF